VYVVKKNMCVCVCVSLGMCVYIYISTNHACLWNNTLVAILASAYIHTHIFYDVFVSVPVYMCVCVHIYTYIYIYKFIRIKRAYEAWGLSRFFPRPINIYTRTSKWMIYIYAWVKNICAPESVCNFVCVYTYIRI